MTDASSEQDYRGGSATASGRATAAATRSCRRPRDRLAAMRGGFQATVAAYRYFAERVIKPLPVKLLLPRGFLGLTLAGTLVIGSAGNRGEIVEIGAQGLATPAHRCRVPPLGKGLGAAGSGIEGGPAQELQRVINGFAAIDPF